MRTWWGRALALGLAATVVAGACGNDDNGDSAAGGQALSSKDAPAPAALIASIPSLFAEDPKAAEATYVGRASGSQAYVALVVRDGQAAVYVCDGVDSEWFGGKVEGDKLDLTTEHGTKLTGTVEAGSVVGKLTFRDGGAKDFVASPPTGVGPGIFATTGLFRTKHTLGDEEYLTGWIILSEGVRGTETKSGSTDGFTLNTSSNPGETLRNQLPGPGGGRPRNFLAFAGRDAANTVRAGFVRDSSTNGAVTFVSNGKDLGAWLTGTVTATSGKLTGSDGSVLNVSIANNKATLDGTVGGKRIVVIADPAASQATGLFRTVELTTDRRRVEFGEIVLNDGTINGLGSSGGAVYFSAQVDTDAPAASDGVITDNSGRTPSGDQQVLALQLRCKLLYHRGAVLQVNPTFTPEQAEQYNRLEARYNSLGCNTDDGLGVGFPQS